MKRAKEIRKDIHCLFQIINAQNEHFPGLKVTWSVIMNIYILWESQVEIEHFLLHVLAMFKALQHGDFVKGGAHTCWVKSWILIMFTQCIWALPLTKVLHGNTISTWNCYKWCEKSTVCLASVGAHLNNNAWANFDTGYHACSAYYVFNISFSKGAYSPCIMIQQYIFGISDEQPIPKNVREAVTTMKNILNLDFVYVLWFLYHWSFL